MALTSANEILGLAEKIKEYAVPAESKIKLTPLKIVSPSVSITYYGWANITSDVTLADNEEIIGYAAKYNGGDWFVLVNCSKNASNKVVLRLYNTTGYDHVTSGDIVGVVITQIVEEI